MTDARRIAARAAYDGTQNGHFFDLCYAVCAAMIDYDAAQPQPREEVVQHSGQTRDKSAAPLVGADPLGLAVLRVAVAHLTDDAVVEAARDAYCDDIGIHLARVISPKAIRAALAAAGRALMGETDG